MNWMSKLAIVFSVLAIGIAALNEYEQRKFDQAMERQKARAFTTQAMSGYVTSTELYDIYAIACPPCQLNNQSSPRCRITTLQMIKEGRCPSRGLVNIP